MVKRPLTAVFFFVFLWAANSFGAGSVERATTVSAFYDARSVFNNPAALGFQTELNGAEMLGAFAYGVLENEIDNAQFALSYGYLGLGVERLSDIGDRYNRFSAALGFPLLPRWYGGFRYRTTRSDVPGLDHQDYLDLGLQFRPHPKLAFGVLASELNRVADTKDDRPFLLAVGASFRPWRPLTLSADVRTPSTDFAKHFSYQGLAEMEIARGVHVRAAYDDEIKFQAGLQISFGSASVYSVAQTASGQKGIISGIQVSPTPYPSAIAPEQIYKMEIETSLRETPVRGGLFGKDRPSLWHVLRNLERAEKSRDVRVVVLKLSGFPLGLAAAQEVNEALWRIRQAGKEVEVFLENSGIKEYLIASAANTIHLEPTAEIRFLGLKSERYFLKGTLDKVGVEGEFLAKGEYKSAPEMFTRQESSPINRNETLQSLKTAEGIVLSILEKSRRVNREKWKAMLEDALLDAPQAKQYGLIDKIDHFEDALEATKKEYFVRHSLRERSNRLSIPPRVAIIVASGDILQDKVKALSFAGHPQLTPERMERSFSRVMDDYRTEAVVLRVTSPGGEVVASDEIANIVTRAKRNKPVIVSMGDVAASGGYMISAPANKIYASSLSLTGSIGVFLGKFNLGNLYKKIELHKEVLSHAPFAGLLTEHRPWTPEEKEILARRLDQYYDGFVSFVAEQRHLSRDVAESSAKGRVWLGIDAKARHLTDETGGYHEAVQAAAEAAGLTDYETEIVEESRGLFDLFGDEGPFMTSPWEPLARGLISEPLLEDLRWMERLRSSPFLYLSPLRSME